VDARPSHPGISHVSVPPLTLGELEGLRAVRDHESSQQVLIAALAAACSLPASAAATADLEPRSPRV